MASIDAALRRIKDNPLGILDDKLIGRVCDENHYRWRDRVLDPATTVALFMQQVLHGNVPCSELRHLAAKASAPVTTAPFTTQAYCDARARLPLAVYQTLVFELHQRVMQRCGEKQHLWHGHRTFHIDGSSVSLSTRQ